MGNNACADQQLTKLRGELRAARLAEDVWRATATAAMVEAETLKERVAVLERHLNPPLEDDEVVGA